LLGVDINFRGRQVIERPRVGDSYFTSLLLKAMLRLETWDRAVPLGGCSPRLCQLRTNGLILVSKYWTYRSHIGDMGPISLVAGCQQMIDFAPTASMVVLGEKLGTNPLIDQPTCCGLCLEPCFSGAVDILNSVDDYTKGCYALTIWDTYDLRPYVDWAWDTCGVLVGFPLHGVHQFESSWLSDMSNLLFVAIST
jgi:hypothetical protein